MKYIKCTSIDSKVFEADSDEEAMEKFKEIIKYDIHGIAAKDYFVAKMIGCYGDWSIHPSREFIVVSKQSEVK